MTFLPDFGSTYVRHLRKRLSPSLMWTSDKVAEADRIAEQINQCQPIQDHMSEFDRQALVDAINTRDMEGVEDVYNLAELKSLRPWCVPVIKAAIALAMGDTPTSIRIATTNLIGVDIMWD